MGTGNYNCKELMFSMHSEKEFAGRKGHFCWFWHALSVAEGNVYGLVLTPFPRINVSSLFSFADVLKLHLLLKIWTNIRLLLRFMVFILFASMFKVVFIVSKIYAADMISR